MLGNHRPHVIPAQTQRDVAAEWDSAAMLRLEQITHHRDLSFDHVLLPTILELSKDCSLERVLDAGCGVGAVAAALARRGATALLGADLSPKSIRLAMETFSSDRLQYRVTSVEDLSNEYDQTPFTHVVANMSLMTATALPEFLRAVCKLLHPDGRFVFTIPHPCFWPAYWGYDTAEWFDYTRELWVQAEFKISLQEHTGIVTSHIHRPLERYADELVAAGFSIEAFREPMPSPSSASLFPSRWKFPRFLACRAVRR